MSPITIISEYFRILNVYILTIPILQVRKRQSKVGMPKRDQAPTFPWNQWKALFLLSIPPLVIFPMSYRKPMVGPGNEPRSAEHQESALTIGPFFFCITALHAPHMVTGSSMFHCGCDVPPLMNSGKFLLRGAINQILWQTWKEMKAKLKAPLSFALWDVQHVGPDPVMCYMLSIPI